MSFLRSIGAWEHLDTDRVQNYQEMQVWDGVSGSRISFDWSMETSPFEDKPSVATMTENANLVRGLLARIAASGDENLSVFENMTVASIENGSDHLPDGPDLSAWPVLSVAPTGSAASTKPASRIAARLLVGADGINSPVRSFADIPTHGWDYNRHGVVATLALAEPDVPPFPASMRTAYQRFLPALGGPIALLPLPNNHATLVWSTTPEHAAYLKSLSAPAFLAMVNAAFRLSMTDLKYMMGIDRATSAEQTSPHEDELSWRLQHTPLPSQIPPTAIGLQQGTVASFPLRFRHAAQYVSPVLLSLATPRTLSTRSPAKASTSVSPTSLPSLAQSSMPSPTAWISGICSPSITTPRNGTSPMLKLVALVICFIRCTMSLETGPSLGRAAWGWMLLTGCLLSSRS